MLVCVGENKEKENGYTSCIPPIMISLTYILYIFTIVNNFVSFLF